MRRFASLKFLMAGIAAAMALRSEPLLACAACYGKSDSPLAAGMNAGIFSLLAVVGLVLGGFAAFGIYLVKRAASVAAARAAAQPALEAAQKI